MEEEREKRKPRSWLGSIVSARRKLKEESLKAKKQSSEVSEFLKGVKNLHPTYGEISKNRDYTGEIEVSDPKTGETYLFHFRVWQSDTRQEIITSEGKQYLGFWALPTLLVKPLPNSPDPDYFAAAEKFKNAHSFTLKCALIEAVIINLTKKTN